MTWEPLMTTLVALGVPILAYLTMRATNKSAALARSVEAKIAADAKLAEEASLIRAEERDQAAAERAEDRAERRRVAQQVVEVKTALVDTTARQESKLDNLGVVAAATLHLVNSGTANTLRLAVEAARVRVAEHDTAGTRTVLATAERVLAEHLAKQAVADQAAGGAQKIVDAGAALDKPSAGRRETS